MNGFTGVKTAASEQLPDAVAVMDPFHVAAVRHEALCVRAEVRDHRRRGVAASRA
jgi:transposase